MANLVLAEMAYVQDDAGATIRHRSVAFRLMNRAAENLARIAPKTTATVESPVEEDPFGPALNSGPVKVGPEDAPPVDNMVKNSVSPHYRGKQLVGKHLGIIAVSHSDALL